MEKQTFIKNLLPGSNISDIFLLAAATQGQARNGPYWRLELRDASGSISGKVWSPLSLEYNEMPVGEFLQVSGRVGSYRDKTELAITSMEKLTKAEQDALSITDFVPSSPFDPVNMLSSLKELCKKELTYKPWFDFVFTLLEDKDVSERLLVFPAAKSMHHAYAGGLLEHTLSVSRLCLMLADHYTNLDRQLLLVGAICHDLGKIWELTSGLTIDYTEEGRLIGHIVLVMERLRPMITSSGLDESLAMHLQHLILSHHGSLEFGSPKLPATAEALILHYADNIDAKMQQIGSALAHIENGPGWSSYIPSLERFLYKAASTPLSYEIFHPTENYIMNENDERTSLSESDSSVNICKNIINTDESVYKKIDMHTEVNEDSSPNDPVAPDLNSNHATEEEKIYVQEESESIHFSSFEEGPNSEEIGEDITPEAKRKKLDNIEEEVKSSLPLDGVLFAQQDTQADSIQKDQTKLGPQTLSLLDHCLTISEK